MQIVALNELKHFKLKIVCTQFTYEVCAPSAVHFGTNYSVCPNSVHREKNRNKFALI